MSETPPFRSFWDRAYEDGDHLEHWEAPEVPAELVAAVEDGQVPEGVDLERARWPEGTPGVGGGGGAEGGGGEDGESLAPLLAVDLGCGTGLEAVWLAQRGFRVAGVDDSRAALALARRRAAEAGVEVEWHHASVFDLPLADASAGLALDRGCFHALHPEDRHLYAEEVARILVPAGALLLRGAAEEDEDAGLWPVDEVHVDLFFPPELFHRGPFLPVPLQSRAGTLPGNAVWLVRR